MKIIMADINSKFTDAVKDVIKKKGFKDITELSTHTGSFTDLADPQKNICMVGAGNSFGLLSGGVDLAIRNFFGKEVEQKLHNTILEDFSGELVVGSSLVLATGNAGIKFLGYTPTMRTPKKITGSDIPYTATLSALSSIMRYNKTNDKQIDTVILPGMGTGTGAIPFSKAALQMVYAIDNFYKALKSGAQPVRTMREAYVVENNLKECS